MPPIRPLLVLAAAALAAAGVIGSLDAQPRVERGFTTAVSERLIQAYSQRFGPLAVERLQAWKRYARARGAAPGTERDLLDEVNRLLNRIAFVEDLAHWGEEDYWATPAESVASNGADCEDYTIAKYFLLKELGVPIARLRLTYVKSVKLNQAHMVLAYYARPDAEPLVLDNLEDRVRPASQRPDLIPVYSFNDEEVWVEMRGRSGSPQQIRNWSALIARLERERRT
ncbi:MAG TPA: transglutaminase-like cysteine peptidase [Burkholderiales bacterium]|nr:transglutaminase-like cysteine peptidase [Burkholderiales bacterium]